MKTEFSKNWNASKQPRKQRKFLAKAPMSIRRKFANVALSKELRAKYGKRSITIRKGDTVKVNVGKFKGKKGKITEVDLKKSKVLIDGLQIKKLDGSKVNVKFVPSNLEIVELNLEDKKRKIQKVKEKKNAS